MDAAFDAQVGSAQVCLFSYRGEAFLGNRQEDECIPQLGRAAQVRGSTGSVGFYVILNVMYFMPVQLQKTGLINKDGDIVADIPVFVCACPINGKLIAFISAFYIISVLPYLSWGYKAKEEYLTIFPALNPTNRNGEVNQ